MTNHLDLIRSAFVGMSWPAVPPEPGALALALQFQLNRTQWLAPDAMVACQIRQLSVLLDHAYETVPFYRERLAAAGYRTGIPVTREWFVTLPLLARTEVQRLGKALHASRLPAGHGPVRAGYTSGSTGTPVAILATAVTRMFWQAFNLRDQLWRRRDLGLKFAAIRNDRGMGAEQEVDLSDWGPATADAFHGGPAALFSTANTLDRQIEWLAAQEPAYLLTLGSNLHGLAREIKQRGVRLSRLREVTTYGDTLDAEARAECEALLGVRVIDTYSAQEVGYIALQCPDESGYHVQSESVLVEIVDERGNPCAPGAMGRVVVTALHNFALPLVRYEIGDIAEAGAPCACGRGLPVIRRILGRVRNLATTPDGRRFFPSFPARKWMPVAPIRQLQLIQKSRLRIEARVAALRPLTASEELALIETLRQSLGHPYDIAVDYVDSIPRTPSGKFEDFLSEL